MPRTESKQNKTTESKNVKVSKKSGEQTKKLTTVKKQPTVDKQTKEPKLKVQKTENMSKEKKSKKETTSNVETKLQKTEHDATQESETNSKFKTQLASIRSEVKSVRKAIISLSSNLKALESAYQHDVKKALKTKPKRKNDREPAGFLKEKQVPKKLALFLGVKPGTELTGPQITSAVWKKLSEKGLLSEDDKRVFKVDKEVSDLFGVPTSVNKVKDYNDKKNGFNFRNLQTYIANAMRE